MAKTQRSDIFPSIPADGVEFELTLETTIDPMEMLRSDGYDPRKWKFIGSQVVPQTRRFKLIRVGYCANLDKVREKLATHGFIPEGQWREAFKKAFPTNDGKGPIGFADPSWVFPFGDVGFPVLYGHGKVWDSRFFCWAGNGRGGPWRWLVAVGK